MKDFIFMLTFCDIYVIIIKTKIVYENFNELKSRGELDMRKKILAIALATTMAFSTAVVAVPANKNVAEAAVGDATVKDLDIGDAFTANTGDEDVSGNFQLVYKFTNKSVGTNNWDNYIVEIFDGAGQYISTRADNFGWFAGTWLDDGSTMEWGDGAADWNTYLEVMKDASVTVTVKRVGSKITITNKIVSNADSSKSYKFVANCDVPNAADALKVHLTGEKVGLSGITTEYKKVSASSNSNSSSSSKKKSMSVKKVTAKAGKKVVKGTVSVAKAKVKVTVGKDKAKTAKVSGKNFTLKVSSKLKKNTKITVKVTKSGYKTVTKTVKVK